VIELNLCRVGATARQSSERHSSAFDASTTVLIADLLPMIAERELSSVFD
jgi:hypothetical protein